MTEDDLIVYIRNNKITTKNLQDIWTKEMLYGQVFIVFLKED